MNRLIWVSNVIFKQTIKHQASNRTLYIPPPPLVPADFIAQHNPNSHPLIPSSHKLKLIIRRPTSLRKTKTPFNALQELARDFIAHDVRLAFIALVQFFAGGTFVDADHGYADGPGAVSVKLEKKCDVGR